MSGAYTEEHEMTESEKAVQAALTAIKASPQEYDDRVWSAYHKEACRDAWAAVEAAREAARAAPWMCASDIADKRNMK
jgi:hypothetical protein